MIKRLWSLLNCKLNKIISLLTILFVISLFSCCYADTNITWTDTKIKNVLLNFYASKTNYDTEQGKAALDNYDTQIQTLVNDLNNNAYCYIMMRTSGRIDIAVWNSTNNQNSHPWWRNSNRVQFVNRPAGTLYGYTYSNGTTWSISSSTNLNDASSWEHYTDIYYFGTEVYSASNSNTILFANGSFAPNSLFDENFYSSTVWEFDPIRDEYCTISGDPMNLPYYLVSKDFAKTYFGVFKDSYYCQSLDIYCRGWLNDEYQDIWELYYEDITNQFATNVNNDIGESIIYVKSNILTPNTTIQMYFTPNTPELETYAFRFYIVDNTTVINNGVIDIQASINNNPNYYDDVSSTLDNISTDQNYINIQDIMNSITDNSQVDNVTNEYFGTSGDVLNNLGYQDYASQNPYGNVFLTFVNGVRQVFLDSGAVTLSCTVHGQTFTFNSDDFQNPSPVLKAFTSSTCIFVTLYFYFQLAFNFVNAMTDGDFFGLIEVVRKHAGIIKYM